ncbi:BRCT domain-containing protein [Psychrobacter aestuarii]|uniref:BRCT domain-containing protein n=1 Tax=Psychrobacter aestuarii TaxID=556327 RepID=A0ABP3FF66_9GAMM|nr:BRCT domain-containing protein [Psychrobacter aestuarii]
MYLSFSYIYQAWQAEDPNLIEKLDQLARQPDAPRDTPLPDDVLTFERFLATIFAPEFRALPPEVQFAKRVELMAQLESADGSYTLPPRYQTYVILLALWGDNRPYARAMLIQAIDTLPLTYGVWRGLKYIYKQAEYRQDYEIFAHIAAKVDLYRFDQHLKNAVSLRTKTYISLRAWRYLRHLGTHLPICYTDAAVRVLASIDAEMTLGSSARVNSWVLNHICFHHEVHYGVNRFVHNAPRKLFSAEGRAFASAWQRDETPLFTLLANAKNEAIRQFATDSLKHDFKIKLKDTDAPTIQYLSAGTRSCARDELVTWLLERSSSLEKSQFMTLGLHDVVLSLLHSDYSKAYQYAISYATSYAKDIDLDTLLLLAVSRHASIRDFAMQMILSRHPIKDIGVQGWGQLLETPYHFKTASNQLTAHFTRKELTPEWFRARLLGNSPEAVSFAIQQLPKLYSAKTLGADFFIDIARTLLPTYSQNQAACMDFVLEELRKTDLSTIDPSVWQYLLLHPLAQETLSDWIDTDVIAATRLPMDYWHALAYEPDWQAGVQPNGVIYNAVFDQVDTAIKTTVYQDWFSYLSFDVYFATEWVHHWLSDVRRFVPTALGFDWLLMLAHSDTAMYRKFAIDCMNKGFLPADFAEPETNPATNINSNQSGDKKSNIDFEQQRFLFTGKMQSMSRSAAEAEVKAHNGLISSGVNNSLDYLVIGDEGSPFYGHGRKGSKQLKAEKLIEAGASMHIISETAFLQMLSGTTREASTDATLAGTERLWSMATDDPTAPISELAIYYMSHHHDSIHMSLTDRPVDSNAAIPNAFFSAERVVPLLSSGHSNLREFGLLLARHELARWQLTPKLWLSLAESTHQEVQHLLQQALFDKPNISNRLYHIDSSRYSTAMINALISSKQTHARRIGIALLKQHPQFQDVRLLYLLTQSSHRDIRYAAVSMLWQQYKHKAVIPSRHQYTEDGKNKGAENNTKNAPQSLPADIEQLLLLLRRGLFELPPGRMRNPEQKTAAKKHNKYRTDDPSTPSELSQSLLSASQAKLALIETFRDIALTDMSFAALIIADLYTFTHSAGKMERHASLTAVTRLLHRYPTLREHLLPAPA